MASSRPGTPTDVCGVPSTDVWSSVQAICPGNLSMFSARCPGNGDTLGLAARFFDRNCAGLLEGDDIEEIVFMTAPPISRASQRRVSAPAMCFGVAGVSWQRSRHQALLLVEAGCFAHACVSLMGRF